jgi:hypothetical protein
MARQAIDVTISDIIGSSNLTDVRKALLSPSADPAFNDVRRWARFAATITQVQLMVSGTHPVENQAIVPYWQVA